MDKYMVKDKHKDSYMTTARLYQGRLFFLVDLGPAPGACRLPAAVSDMRIDINNGHSYYMTVACRRRRRFFL